MSNILNTKQAAENLGVSVRRIQALIKNDQLKAEKFGRDFMIRESDLPKLKKLKRGRPMKTKKADAPETVKTVAPELETMSIDEIFERMKRNIEKGEFFK